MICLNIQEFLKINFIDARFLLEKIPLKIKECLILNQLIWFKSLVAGNQLFPNVCKSSDFFLG